MKYLTIKRVETGEQGTFGVLIYKQIPFAVTLERQWLNNKVGVSCIPAGAYTCKRVDSPKFGDTFEVIDVDERSHILFHKGNLDDDSHGCILLGEKYGNLGVNSGILDSSIGYAEFMNLLSDDQYFNLTIIDHFMAGVGV